MLCYLSCSTVWRSPVSYEEHFKKRFNNGVCVKKFRCSKVLTEIMRLAILEYDGLRILCSFLQVFKASRASIISLSVLTEFEISPVYCINLLVYVLLSMIDTRFCMFCSFQG